MKEVLIDVMRQAAPLFDKIRILGSETSTQIEAYSDDKMLFLFADLRDVVPELAGECGLSNLQLLRFLLDFPTYKADNAKFQAHRALRQGDGVDYVAELDFADATGGHTRFKTINPRMLGERAKVLAVNWGATVTPSKAKLTEVVQLAGMLSQVDEHFTVACENRTLFLSVGGQSASSHNATVALATDIDCGSLPTRMMFKMSHFLSVMKNAAQPTIRFAEEGIVSILTETEFGSYNFVLRGKVS